MLMLQFISGRLISFWNLFIYVNNSQYTFYITYLNYWEARKAVSQACRTLRGPDIYAYVERLGINSSLLRPRYKLPIAMVASSRKKKSHHGITIRKNKRSVSTVEGSSSHLSCTKSSHSNNVGSASKMIPCFPASNGTDAHYCDTYNYDTTWGQ